MPTPEAIDLADRLWDRWEASIDHREFDVEQAAEEIDRFAAQRGAEAWLPIETAPKDGTRIVLTDGDVPVVGLWRAHDEQWIVDWDHEPYQDSPREAPATHWMPLPSNKPGAPAQTGEEH